MIVLLVTVVLRLYQLPRLPLGLHYDEAANGILAGEIANGTKTPIFIPSYTGKEVLFFYWTALWMKVFGVTPVALRLGAASLGVATVVVTVWGVYELLHAHHEARWIALIASAFLSTSFWHLVLSRYGFRAIAQPLFQMLTVAALWRGLRLSSDGGRDNVVTGWLLLAGLGCGLTAYTYLAARAFPLPLATALLALLIVDRDNWRVRGFQVAVFVLAAVLALTPLVYYWSIHPGSFLVRARQVAADNWIEVRQGLLACANMFFVRGDPYIRFNLPHRPLFGPLVAGLFVLGVAVVLWRSVRLVGDPERRVSSLPIASYVFLLTSVPMMILPSALATDEITPSNLRTVGLLPFIYVFPALGLSVLKSVLERVGEWVTALSDSKMSDGIVYLTVSAFLLGLSGSTTGIAYFRDWASSAALYYAADGDVADVAHYLNQVDLSSTTPYVASQHYRHPTMAFLSQDYDEIRWLTGGQTLVFPAQGEALFLFPRSVSGSLDWVRSVLPRAAFVDAPLGPDAEPAFHVYRTRGVEKATPPRRQSANLGDVIHLTGYEILNEPRSGEGVEIAVWWRVTGDAGEDDYRPVARLADQHGLIWGESQPFHYTSAQWTHGELILDRLWIPVAAGAPPGNYVVRLGCYSPTADRRLPVLDDGGAYAGIYTELPVRLARAEVPPQIEDLDIRNREMATVDGLTFLGSTLGTKAARPGEPLDLTLFWRADEAALSACNYSLQVGDTILYEGGPARGSYPFSEWNKGEVIADRHRLRLPRQAGPGEYPLQLRITDKAPVVLGAVTVQETDRSFEIPAMSHSVAVTLGDRIELLGYDLSADAIMPGERLTLTLYWRPLSELRTDYTVFTHLLASDGSMTGQQDNQPLGGGYPTSLWLSGEVVTDIYEISVRRKASPGEHRLEVGMYVADTGARLAVEGSPDDAVTLQTVTVTQ